MVVELDKTFRVGNWMVDPVARSFSDGKDTLRVDPKAIDLLELLASRPGEVVTRDEIFDAIWPNVIVGEDTLAKTISRLRKALGDQAVNARYIETVPKRGYRLIADLSTLEPMEPANSLWLWIGAAAAVLVLPVLFFFAFPSAEAKDPLTARADDLYMKFTREDNEAAIGLYERVLSESPNDAAAQSGLANALVQRVIRWSDASPQEDVTLKNALAMGTTSTADAELILTRAQIMAEEAVRRAPGDPDTLKALGFVLSAQGKIKEAQRVYQQTIEIDPDAWAALINLAETYSIQGDRKTALTYLERAYAAMEAKYFEEPQHIGGWQADLGLVIGEYHIAFEDFKTAEEWYQRVLDQRPFHEGATKALSEVLLATGRGGEAVALCAARAKRMGLEAGC